MSVAAKREQTCAALLPYCFQQKCAWTPHGVKMELEALAMGRGVEVIGPHSVVLEDDVVDCIFDIAPDANGNGLHFRFERRALVGKDDIDAFALWLAAPINLGEVTIH